jgi:hypothetical protein
MGFGGMGSGPMMGGDVGYGSMGGDMRERTQVSSTTSHDVPVEIYGIIYIYNPVDKERLGLQDTTSLTGTVPADETPAG